MSWSTASDLKAQVMRLWERGELLRDGIVLDGQLGVDGGVLRRQLAGDQGIDGADLGAGGLDGADQLLDAVQGEVVAGQERVQGGDLLVECREGVPDA